MSDTFAAPAAPGEGIQWMDLLGRLLLIEPSGVERGIETDYGDRDAVRADVTVLDGDNPGEEYSDTLIFPKVLSGQIQRVKGFPNVKVLGRLEQGEAKRGQKPPWRIREVTQQDIELGSRYLTHRNSQSIQAPAPQQQPAPQPQQQAPQQQWPQQAAGTTQQPAQSGQVPF